MCIIQQIRIPFKLSDLNKLYYQWLNELGIAVKSRIHSTRLKNQIMSHFLGMQSFPEVWEVLLAFDAGIGKVLGNSFGLIMTIKDSLLQEQLKSYEGSFISFILYYYYNIESDQNLQYASNCTPRNRYTFFVSGCEYCVC